MLPVGIVGGWLASLPALAAAAPGDPGAAPRFEELRLGLFVHYMYVGRPYQWGSTPCADGQPVGSLDELADGLDVPDMVELARTMRAQYLQFTTWHANMNALYPSAVLAQRLPGHCARRDVIRDLIEALRPTGIRLILYLHPSDGHDFSPEDQERVGWNDGPPYARWNDFINAAFAEVVERYGQEVAGYWIDGGLPPQVDPARLRATIEQRDPGAWLIQNSGLNPACVDYGAHESLVAPYPGTAWQMCATIGDSWWASGSAERIGPDLAFQYTVLQAGVEGNTGGVAWSCGPYPGGQWEPHVRPFAQRLGEQVGRVAEALFGTRPNSAFVTRDGTPLTDVAYVATESLLGDTTYLHVLRPPAERQLDLPPPADGRVFTAAALLGDGGPVELAQDDQGVHLALSADDAWDPLDTVIVLRSAPGSTPSTGR